MVSRYLIHHWLIDNESGSLLHHETAEQRKLGEYQLRLLTILAENAGKIVTREALTELVWERRVIGNNSLPNAIHALRVALNDSGKQQRIIKTVPRRGYILEKEYCQRLAAETDETATTAPSGVTDMMAAATASSDVTDMMAAAAPLSIPDKASLYLPTVRFWRSLCLMQSLVLMALLTWLCL